MFALMCQLVTYYYDTNCMNLKILYFTKCYEFCTYGGTSLKLWKTFIIIRTQLSVTKVIPCADPRICANRTLN